jgi:predicted DNA-binding transcriptional regulator AlpA
VADQDPHSRLHPDKDRKGRRYLRFRDLKERGIVGSWETLVELIDRCGFPRGFKFSHKIRSWDEAEIDAWIESKRIGAPSEAA